MREEIGDHIFEGVLLAQIAAELGAFSVADALRAVADKLVRRHPHVFREDGRLHDAASKERAPSADAALARWDAQKAQERPAAGETQPTLGGLPRSLPALLRAYKLSKRAAGVGFDWAARRTSSTRSGRKSTNWPRSWRRSRPDPARAEEEMGDLLFAIANLSRKLGIEPEAALRKANEKFTRRFEAMEQAIVESGRRMQDMSLEELEEQWQQSNAATKDSHEDTKTRRHERSHEGTSGTKAEITRPTHEGSREPCSDRRNRSGAHMSSASFSSATERLPHPAHNRKRLELV